MAQNKNSNLLKLTLIIFILITLAYGIIYLFVPQSAVEASGSDPVSSGWLRWIGGIILALGVGGIMVYRKPEKQGIFITTLSLGSFLGGLALLYSGIFEPEGIGNIWHTIIPGIVLLILSIAFWISLKKNKQLLFD